MKLMEIIGQTIDQYDIIEEIGKGGMATVYRATQSSMGRDVALKILHADLAAQDETFVERFYREVKIIANLQHPHILPVHDFGIYEGNPYLIMALYNGGTLSDLIAKGGMDIEEILPLFSQMSSALDFAHKAGIIHRDFKPANVLMDEHGNTYLADFGLSAIAESDSQLTGSGIVGTPDYMAPDLANEAGLTPSIDVYALAVTLYQMLTGEVPYRGSTGMGTVMAHMTEEVPNILEARPDLPKGIKKVIDMGMAKTAKERYKSSGGLFDALKSVFGESEEIPKGLVFTNVMGHVVYVNSAFLRMVMRSEGEARTIAGKPLFEVLGIEKETSDEMIDDAARIGNIHGKKMNLKDANGENLSVSTSAMATYDDKGELVGIDFSLQLLSGTGSLDFESEPLEDDFSTGEKSYIEFYFGSQLDALRALLVKVGGPRLGNTLERIINETAERNNWELTYESGKVKNQLQSTETYVYNALLVKAMTYAISVIGVDIVKKQVNAVDEQLGEKAKQLSLKLGIKEVFIDQK